MLKNTPQLDRRLCRFAQLRSAIRGSALWRSVLVATVLAGCNTPTMVATDGRSDGAADAAADAAVPMPTCVPPLDLDGDGAFDDRCADGTDCDDRDPTVRPGAPELCGNSIDDDCDGVTDATCVDATGSSCAAPTILTVSNTIAATLYAGGADPACFGLGYYSGRHVIRVDLSEPRAVSLSTAWPEYDDSRSAFFIALDVCDGASTGCSPSIAGAGSTSLAFAGLPEGSYFFEVRGESGPSAITGEAPSFDVRVEITPPILPPDNDTCERALAIPGARGTTMHRVELTASSVDPLADACSVAKDVYFRFELSAPSDVTLDFASEVAGAYGIALYSGECVGATTVQCVPEITEGLLMRALSPGGYLVRVSGPDNGLGTLTVTLSAPTVARPGETCADPTPLVPGVWAADTLDDRALDHGPTECGNDDSFLRDVVYDFTLSAPSEVQVVVRGADGSPTASIQASCGTVGSVPEQRCSEPALAWWFDGGALRTRASRLPAGRYYVVVRAGRFERIETLLLVEAPKSITPVGGNVDCASARVLSSSPGLTVYSGTFESTTGPIFRIDLPISAGGRFVANAHLFTPPARGSARPTVLGQVLWARGCGGAEPVPGAPISFEGGLLHAGTYYIEVEPMSDVSRYELAFEIGGAP